VEKVSLEQPQLLTEVVDYQEGAIVSRSLLSTRKGSTTVFAFDAGQGLSEHTVAVTALVLVIEGRAAVTVGGVRRLVSSGQALHLPAAVSHAVEAEGRFKMLLTLIREE
jgi:quercetin dioxygenase-like cupin family protein